MNRLDKIEHEAREIAKYMEGTVDIDCTTTGDILALVAVVRAAEAYRDARVAVVTYGLRKDYRLKRQARVDMGAAYMALCAALTLESTAPRQRAAHE